MIVYVLATCLPGHEKETIMRIKKLLHVKEVNGIMGRFDIFVKVAAQDDRDVFLAIAKMRDISSITSTFTFSAISGQGGTVDNENQQQK